jgi:L-gulonolactone oxidase
MHTLTAATLATRYPHWEDFLRVRARLDPNGVFLNGYLRGLFGVAGAGQAAGPAADEAQLPLS